MKPIVSTILILAVTLAGMFMPALTQGGGKALPELLGVWTGKSHVKEGDAGEQFTLMISLGTDQKWSITSLTAMPGKTPWSDGVRYGTAVVDNGQFTAMAEGKDKVRYSLSGKISGGKVEGMEVREKAGEILSKKTFVLDCDLSLSTAMRSQASGQYACDEWELKTLEEGDKVYGGIPGQSAYYTTKKTLDASLLSSPKLFKSLQVAPHPKFGYRTQMQEYTVNKKMTVPAGASLANPKLGDGGGDQFFIADFKNALTPTANVIKLTK
jgi:hypothetical protein